jgi:hypothetical protein
VAQRGRAGSQDGLPAPPLLTRAEICVSQQSIPLSILASARAPQRGVRARSLGARARAAPRGGRTGAPRRRGGRTGAPRGKLSCACASGSPRRCTWGRTCTPHRLPSGSRSRRCPASSSARTTRRRRRPHSRRRPRAPSRRSCARGSRCSCSRCLRAGWVRGGGGAPQGTGAGRRLGGRSQGGAPGGVFGAHFLAAMPLKSPQRDPQCFLNTPVTVNLLAHWRSPRPQSCARRPRTLPRRVSGQ